MKKIFSILLTIFLLTGVITSCSDVGTKTDSDKLNIVCTIFPAYDWVREVMGDNADRANITMLLSSGVDLHSYQPTVDDIINISNCDMFVYVGGESDLWVDAVLEQALNKDMIVVNMLDVLGSSVKEQEIVEGMVHTHDHDHDEDEHEHDEHDHELDEHIWLSLRNAALLTSHIAGQLDKLDSEISDSYYQTNAETYMKKLAELDDKYSETVKAANYTTLLFADRFPFRYLIDDYGLSYYAAFSDCSAETEASFETVAFLAQKVDELNLKSVMTIDGTTHKIAETVINNTKNKNQAIVMLDSLQSTTLKDVENGATYLSIMEKNLDALKTALN